MSIPMELKNDYVRSCAKDRGWDIEYRTVFVEGTTDVDILNLSSKIIYENDKCNLLEGMAIIASGEKEEGGVNGITRELITFRNMSRNLFLPNGRTAYRFIGLFDYDHAGRIAIKDVKRADPSLLEHHDLFNIKPIMPTSGNLDPKTLGKTFDKLNYDYKGLDWEIEDYLDEGFLNYFADENPSAIKHPVTINGKTHRELTKDGKAKLHRFVKDHANYNDLKGFKDLLMSLRFIFALKI